MTTREALPVVLGGIDEAYQRLHARLQGLTTDEYRWEPVPGCWSVHPNGEGWEVTHGREQPDPDPAPVTTIAWRLWHIASDCLASYVSPGLGPWPLEVDAQGWYGEAEPAIGALEQAFTAFRERIAGLGEDGAWQPLGPDWGPFGDEPWLALAVHAHDELSHHGAEIALLRDLYRARVNPN